MPNRYLTNSELTDFRRCKRKHYLRHVMKLARPDSGAKTAHIGTLAHEILEAFYRGEDPETVLARYDPADIEDEQERADAEVAHAIAAGYVDWLAEEGADQQHEPVAVEGEYARPIPGMPGWFGLGKLDLILRHRETGEILPSDHKTTAATIETFLGGLKWRTQWRHYAWLLEGVFPEWPVVLRFLVTVLRQSKRTARAKPPFYARHTLPLNRAEVVSYGAQIGVWAKEIQAAEQSPEIPPPSPGDDCKWLCPFATMCPRMDDGSDWRAYADAELETRDPLARYSEAYRNEP